MTEQSPSDKLNRASNEIFEATSFLNGTNAAYVEQLYAAWLANPGSVEEGWQAYFAQAGEQGLSPTQLGRGPAWKRDLAAVARDLATSCVSRAAAEHDYGVVTRDDGSIDNAATQALRQRMAQGEGT